MFFPDKDYTPVIMKMIMKTPLHREIRFPSVLEVSQLKGIVKFLDIICFSFGVTTVHVNVIGQFYVVQVSQSQKTFEVCVIGRLDN